MKLPDFPNSFPPLYVLAAGTIGIIIAFLLFSWNYPYPGDDNGEKFTGVPEFWVWVFLFAVLFALLTIFFIPAWLSLRVTFKKWVLDSKDVHNWGSVLSLALGAILLLGFLAFFIATQDTVQLEFRHLFPDGHTERMSIVFVSIILVLLPTALVILLLYSASQQLNKDILKARQDESELFQFVDKVIGLRQTLQNHLLLAGIILSLMTILTASLRSIIIAVDESNGDSFPMTFVFTYGLVFTLLLIFIYAPTHIGVSGSSRELRDRLCNITSMSNMENNFRKRKILDELLQTNIGLGQNLKSGVVTLTPMLTGLIVSLLGVNI